MAKFTTLFLLSLASFAAVWIADASTTVVVGGYSYVDDTYSRKVDVISDGKVTSLADLPTGTSGNGVIIHDNKLYSCGGMDTGTFSTRKCVILDLKAASPSWSSTLQLDEFSTYDPIIAVGDTFWILGDNEVIVFPFNGNDKSVYELPKGLSGTNFGGCGGGDESVRFVIPRVSSEVWINTDSQNPGEWTKLDVTLGISAQFRSCMLKGGNIYVTGGESGPSSNHISNAVAEKIYIDDGTVQSLPNLLHERSNHGMGIIDGYVAVFGGSDGTTTIGSVEVYHEHVGEWKSHSLALSAGVIEGMGYLTY